MNKSEAFALLDSLDAPDHLVTHVTLVGEAASEIIRCLESLDVEFDKDFVEAGVVLHDVGKIRHPQEMYQKGSEHEAEGQRMLLACSVDSDLAKVCVSHGQWANEDVSMEELLIALSDKLWKGKRVEELENKVVKGVAGLLGVEYWDVFEVLDNCFESVAVGGNERLARSV